MNQFSRRIIAGVLSVIFLAITLSPLANISMLFATVAHAVSGNCTGDCDTCGCSLERRASQTCCCWYNKLKRHDHNNAQEADCCKKAPKKTTATLTSTCPCGSGKPLALCAVQEIQIVPNHFTMEIPTPDEDSLSHNGPDRFTDRNCEPPVPPPKFSHLL